MRSLRQLQSSQQRERCSEPEWSRPTLQWNISYISSTAERARVTGGICLERHQVQCLYPGHISAAVRGTDPRGAEQARQASQPQDHSATTVDGTESFAPFAHVSADTVITEGQRSVCLRQLLRRGGGNYPRLG